MRSDISVDLGYICKVRKNIQIRNASCGLKNSFAFSGYGISDIYENIIFQIADLFFGIENRILKLFKSSGSKSLAVGKSLPSDVIIRDLIKE